LDGVGFQLPKTVVSEAKDSSCFAIGSTRQRVDGTTRQK